MFRIIVLLVSLTLTACIKAKASHVFDVQGTVDQVELSPLLKSDHDHLNSFAQNKTIWKMFRGTEATYSEEWVQAMIRGSQSNLTQLPMQDPFVVGIRLTGKLIGLIGLLHVQKQGAFVSGEVWYILDPEYEGQGFMTRALQLFLVAAFVDGIGAQKVKVKELTAQTLTTNFGSNRLLEKLYFKKIRTWFPTGELEWNEFQIKIEIGYLKYARIKKMLKVPVPCQATPKVD